MKGRNPAGGLAKWRREHPEVEAWVSQELESTVQRAKGRLPAKFERLAHAGSVDHAAFIAKVLGWFNHGFGGSGESEGVRLETPDGVRVTFYR